MSKNPPYIAPKEQIEKIVQILKSIDDKILELNRISAKDFLGFSEILKEYHQKTKELTSQSGKLFEMFNTLEDITLVEETSAIQQAVLPRLGTIKKVSNQISNTIKKTEEDLQQLFVPFNNFRQNLLTLKFLFVNVKLSQWISEPQHAAEINGLIDEISAYIQDTREGLPLLDNDIQFLNQQMTDLSKHIQKIQSQILPSLEHSLNDLSKNLDRITDLKNKTLEDSRRIERHGQQCFKNLDNVITNIQYHDIIRQKMEHIQNTHQTIIDNLVLKSDTTASNPNNDKYLDYLKQIPEVIEIQASQLVFTNKEYQMAIETIMQKLHETSNELISISGICIEKNKNINKIEELFDKLVTQWHETYQSLVEISNLAVQLITTSAYYQDKIENQLRKKEELVSFETKLSTLAEKIRNLQPQDQHNLDLFAKQIEPLLFDTRQSQIKMNQLLPDANHSSIRTQLLNLTETIALTTSGLKSPQSYNREQTRTLLNSMREIVAEMGKTRSNELLQSIEKVTYYDAFDREVEKIIALLNEIYVMLLPYYESTKKSLDLLSTMEENYTMQSQRDLHYGKSVDNKDKESDVELF